MQNALKAQARNRSLKAGHFVVEFATPGIGHLLKNAGCDFALLDMEHSGFSFETVKTVLMYMQAAGLPAIVRVPTREAADIGRALDVGAEGVMVPNVSSAEEALRILKATRYAPQGQRGVAVQLPHDRYQPPGPIAERFAAANARTTLFVQIESREGVESAEAIAAIDGVDCLWIGHMDLSCSLGIPGKFDHLEFRAAVDKVAAACRQHGKALGRLVRDVEQGAELFAQGYDFICYAGDAQLLYRALAEGVAGLRGRCQGAAR